MAWRFISLSAYDITYLRSEIRVMNTQTLLIEFRAKQKDNARFEFD